MSSSRCSSPTAAPSKWKLLLVCSPILVLADQWTKFLAVERLTNVFARGADLSWWEKVAGFYTYRYLELMAREPYDVWRGFWRMTYAENPGSAFGLFGTMPPHLRFAFFTLVTVAAVAYILGAYRRLHLDQRPRQVALALVLSGAVGNFIDRLARRYVVDFIDWGIRDLRWPTFNLADVFVVVGVGVLLLTDGRPIRLIATGRGAGGSSEAADDRRPAPNRT